MYRFVATNHHAFALPAMFGLALSGALLLGGCPSTTSIAGGTSPGGDTSGVDGGSSTSGGTTVPASFVYPELAPGGTLSSLRSDTLAPGTIFLDRTVAFTVGADANQIDAEFRSRIVLLDSGIYLFSYRIAAGTGTAGISLIELSGFGDQVLSAGYYAGGVLNVPTNAPTSAIRQADGNLVTIFYSGATGESGTGALEFETTATAYTENGTATIFTSNGDFVTVTGILMPDDSAAARVGP